MPGALERGAVRFFTTELCRQVVVGILRKRHQKIKCEFMVGGLFHSEEIFTGPQQTPDLSGYSELLGDFAFKRRLRRLSRFNPKKTVGMRERSASS
jgi:hypothetical protein